MLRVRTANKEMTTILSKASRELVTVFATNVGRFFVLIFYYNIKLLQLF
jgi:hypothetical protein